MPKTIIHYGRHQIDQSDIEHVIDVLKTGPITQGEQVPLFEQALCSYTGAEFCTVTTNATSALHIALLALDVGPGDCVWTSPISFVASANCARHCGADVDFVDIDPLTRNLCALKLSEKLKTAAKNNRLPKAIIPVHLSGLPCDLKTIAKHCKAYGVSIIEDASHALGAEYQEKKIGDCHWSDMTVFSFHPVKMITTGEGGAVTTNNPNLKKKLERLRSHGITKNKADMLLSAQPEFYYEQQTLGFNYRMTDLQAALGISQLKRLEAFINQRRHLVSQYRTLLKTLPLTLPPELPERQSAWHIFITNMNKHSDSTKNEHTRNTLYNALRAQNIHCNLHYYPIHLQPYYQTLGFKVGDFPMAEAYAKTALTLPLHANLTENDLERICLIIHEHLTAAR